MFRASEEMLTPHFVTFLVIPLLLGNDVVGYLGNIRTEGSKCSQEVAIKQRRCPLVLQHLIELTQHHGHVFLLLLVIEQAHDRCIVFVENDNYLLTRLLISAMDKGAKTVTRGDRQRVTSIFS